MADNPNPGAGTGAQPAFDPNQFAEALTRSFNAALGEALKPIGDRLSKLEAPPAGQGDGKAAGRNLTAEDIGKVIDERLTKHQASEAKRHARDDFARSKLKDVPTIYHRDLPETDNAAELAAAEQRIRDRYREDLKAAGIKPADVGGHPAAQGKAPQPQGRDVSKWSNSQKIESLIADSKPSLQGTMPAEAQNANAGAEQGNVTQANAV